MSSSPSIEPDSLESAKPESFRLAALGDVEGKIDAYYSVSMRELIDALSFDKVELEMKYKIPSIIRTSVVYVR